MEPSRPPCPHPLPQGRSQPHHLEGLNSLLEIRKLQQEGRKLLIRGFRRENGLSRILGLQFRGRIEGGKRVFGAKGERGGEGR